MGLQNIINIQHPSKFQLMIIETVSVLRDNKQTQRRPIRLHFNVNEYQRLICNVYHWHCGRFSLSSFFSKLFIFITTIVLY